MDNFEKGTRDKFGNGDDIVRCWKMLRKREVRQSTKLEANSTGR